MRWSETAAQRFSRKRFAHKHTLTTGLPAVDGFSNLQDGEPFLNLSRRWGRKYWLFEIRHGSIESLDFGNGLESIS
jgi:hypothetical protein